MFRNITVNLCKEILRMVWAYFGTWHFGKRHFGTDISSRWIFATRTFWHGYFLAPWMFWHGDVTALGHFGTWTFRHMEISAQGHWCRNVYFALHSSKMYMCQNVHVLKYPCGEISQCHNIPAPKRPWCRNITHAKIFSCRKVPVMKCLSWNVSCRNVRCQNIA